MIKANDTDVVIAIYHPCKKLILQLSLRRQVEFFFFHAFSGGDAMSGFMVKERSLHSKHEMC